MNTMACFYLIFWINCYFIKEYLKTSANQINLNNLKEKNFTKFEDNFFNDLARKNLYQFNYMLRLFNFIQNEADQTVVTYYFGNLI